MKYAIKVLENYYKNMIPFVSANADNKQEYSKLRLQQNELLEAISILKLEFKNNSNQFCDCQDSDNYPLKLMCRKCNKEWKIE